MIKLVKKEVTKYFSFGLVDINDEWAVEDTWDGFTKYKNREGLTLITFRTQVGSMLDSMLSEMFIGDESFAVGSPEAILAIKKSEGK
jgi:hypothetical protein